MFIHVDTYTAISDVNNLNCNGMNTTIPTNDKLLSDVRMSHAIANNYSKKLSQNLININAILHYQLPSRRKS